MHSLKITGNYTGCGIGVIPFDGLPDAPSIEGYEAMISREVAVVGFFRDFTCPFPASTCDTIHDHGSIPIINWEPRKWSNPSDNSFSLGHIISGDCDAYIKSFAESAEAWGKPVFIRFAHEMNGYWYPWCGSQNGSNETASSNYKTAWRRIYVTFEAAGATNVTWVWCPMNYSNPSDSWNNAENYYPGDAYVDWVAFDGYSDSGANSDGVYSGIYSTLTSAIFSNKPILIGETARGIGDIANKPAWITDAFSKIKNSYPKIKLYIWFNINKESDWRVNSSQESLNAFKASMTDESYYLSKIQ